jgi:hypothetical protein
MQFDDAKETPCSWPISKDHTLLAQSIYDLHTLAENFENVGERFNREVDRRNPTFAMLNND